MKIKQFIQSQVISPRLKQHGVLVVYDPAQRYRELCMELASEKRQVVDAAISSITSRQAALAAVQELGQPGTAFESVLIYVPAKAPLKDEEKQRDPFAAYIAAGAIFPDGDGDEYLSLCLKARADHATEIRRIFNADPNPPFAVIDAVGGGAGWPNLQVRLGVESGRELLFALLTPSEAQLTALKDGASGIEAWAGEVHALCQSALGLKFLTHSNGWSALADELWRYLLFSEFAFDLPLALPEALAGVPHAPQEARPLVEDLCAWLRSDRRSQSKYIEHAERVQQELDLVQTCQEIDDFGVRDTFPFEERASLHRAADALRRDNLEKLRGVLQRHARSIWTGRSENQAQWNLVESAAALLQVCDETAERLGGHSRSMDELLDFYLNSLRECDCLQREFEQAAGEMLDLSEDLLGVRKQARDTYRKLSESVQTIFLRHVEKSGWPLSGRLANADVFDRLAAPKLAESGHKVALFLIDAVRYELGVELAKQLNDAGTVEVQAACAPLPTVTPVGMAALLPGAGQALVLSKAGAHLGVSLGDQTLANVNQRMDVLRKRYGQRFAEMNLADFSGKLDGAVELLVLRSNEMDEEFESNPDVAPKMISRTFQRICSALHKLAGLGFQDALILTDHGFYLNTALEAGDVCAKAPGNWLNVHERALLGESASAGAGDAANMVFAAESLGLRGGFSQAAFPRSLVAYRAGMVYFHGGLSLHEAIVPVLAVKLQAPEKKSASKLTVQLNYKNGAKRINTRLPVIELSLAGQVDMFGGETGVDVLLEAQTAHGKVVGEAKPGGPVNPATGTIHLAPGQTVQVTLKMEMDFEGKFLVKALDPTTQAGLGKALELETDYMV